MSAEPLSPNSIIENYFAASRGQRALLNGASMEVSISATLPKFKKQGRLHALRKISEIGRITYEALRFEGDGTVKNNVIAKYLAAEVESQKEEAPNLAVTPNHYKFKYKGLKENEGRSVHVFELNPRKKRMGLFKGELWIDAATYLKVREQGRLVKNPSIFLKKVEFVRTYEIRDGVSVPRQIHSLIATRLVGPAEITIDFSNVAIQSAGAEAVLAGVANE